MVEINRLKPIEAAKKFVKQYFPSCQGAVLAGSVVRGEATETSDLDIVVFDNSVTSSYRESLIEFGWAIEVFVHNLTSYKQFFEMDKKSAKPSMPRMVVEGILLKDEGILESIKEEAKAILVNGPKKWTEDNIKLKRYFITDVLDDFIGCTNRAEQLFIANTLADLLQEFVLRTNGQWVGTSKWVIRALKQYDAKFTEAFVEAFDTFYKTGKKEKIIEISEKVLESYGGRLFDGFSLGK
jgi:predicted nucleotidyltransferase